MAIICNDFIAIAKELEEFYNIFTPELKSVTGKPHKINEILERVHKVLELIEHVRERCFVEDGKCMFVVGLGSVWSISYRRSGEMETRLGQLCPTDRRDRWTNEELHFRILQNTTVTSAPSSSSLHSSLFSLFQIGWKCFRYVTEIREEQHPNDHPRRNAQTIQRYSPTIR